MSMDLPPPPPPPGSPAGLVPRSQAAPSAPRAGFGPRLVGLVIDLVIVGVPSEAIFLALGPVSIAIWPALFVAYSVYFISSPSGQTPGMRITGTRAIDASTGGRVRPSKAFARCLMSIVSWMVCFLGYLWMLWDPEKQTWQDKAAGTFVVPTSLYPVDRWPG